MITRREFIKLIGAGLLSLYVAARGKYLPWVLAAIPGRTLDPLAVRNI